jgi:hypothetical protein
VPDRFADRARRCELAAVRRERLFRGVKLEE